MTTKQMEYCIELARTRNFSRAAENLFVSQPTFSYQIRLLEEEVGFAIFERSGKGAALTPAGEQFVTALTAIRQDIQRAVEQGQNFGQRYRDSITVAMMVRQALHFLPEAMETFGRTHPQVQIVPQFRYEGSVEAFLRGEANVVLALAEQVRHVPGVDVYPLYDSRIYLITRCDDPLARQDRVGGGDLRGRTLMVGGGSPPALRAVQNRLLSAGIAHFNSPDHDTTLTNVAAGRGVCLAPGFLNDHSGQFAWIPYDCAEHFSCVLCTHREDKRPAVRDFVALLQALYRSAVAFPL